MPCGAFSSVGEHAHLSPFLMTGQYFSVDKGSPHYCMFFQPLVCLCLDVVLHTAEVLLCFLMELGVLASGSSVKQIRNLIVLSQFIQ